MAWGSGWSKQSTKELLFIFIMRPCTLERFVDVYVKPQGGSSTVEDGLPVSDLDISSIPPSPSLLCIRAEKQTKTKTAGDSTQLAAASAAGVWAPLGSLPCGCSQLSNGVMDGQVSGLPSHAPPRAGLQSASTERSPHGLVCIGW